MAKPCRRCCSSCLPSRFMANSSAAILRRRNSIATSNLALLQQLPLAFLPLLLREVIVYDWKFPAERDEIDRQIRYLGSLTADQLSSTMSSFAKLKLSPDLEGMDWIGAPVALLRKIVCLSMGDSPDRRLQQSSRGLHKSL